MTAADSQHPSDIVDLGFPVRGLRVPEDHGYPLYAALSAVAKGLHNASWLGVHPLVGARPLGEGWLLLTPKAQLRLRLPSSRIGDALPLAGRALDVSGQRLQLGAPSVFVLQPAASLDARIVLLKLTGVPHRSDGPTRGALDTQAMAERYRQEIRRQLDELGIPRAFELCGRRRISVDGERLVGFSVRVTELTGEESLLLQARGIGGKRRMGCGLFRGTRGR